MKKIIVFLSCVLLSTYIMAKPVGDVDTAFKIAVNVEMENTDSNLLDYGVLAIKTYDDIMEAPSDDIILAKNILKTSFLENDMTFVDEEIHKNTGLIRMLFVLTEEPNGYNYVEWNYLTGETAVYSIVDFE